MQYQRRTVSGFEVTDPFVDGYFLAIDSMIGEDEAVTGKRWNRTACERVIADCRRFYEQAKPLIPEHRRHEAGIDFALTRNGAGAGYWDGNWPEYGDELTELANSFPEMDAYLGDDDEIHVIGE